MRGLRGATLVNHVALEDGGSTAYFDCGFRVILQDCAPLDARIDLPLSALALGQLRDEDWRDYFLVVGAGLVLDLAIVFIVIVLLGQSYTILLELG